MKSPDQTEKFHVYTSEVQRQRSANSPWRRGAHCCTKRAKTSFNNLKPRSKK